MCGRRLGLVGLVAALVCGCTGQTDEATNVSSTGATLNATGTCSSGACDYYFRVWPAELGDAWGFSTPTRHLAGMPPNTTASLPPEHVTDLQPATQYRFKACGKEASEATFLCAGAKTFTTLPPSQIGTFTADLTPPNVVTLRWSTSGGDTTQPIHIYGTWHDPATGTFYKDIGFRAEHQNTTGLTFRVRMGLHRYVLSLPLASGRITRTIEIDVPGPSSPNLATPLLRLYSPTLSDTTIAWNNPLSDHSVRIARTGSPDRFNTAVGASSYTFPKAYLESLGVGSHTFDLTMCRSMTGATPKMSGSFCSDRARIVFEIGGADFIGPPRMHLLTGGSAMVSWTATGQYYYLDAPSLGIEGQVVTGTSYTFQNLPAGLHMIALGTCTFEPAACANLATATANIAGTLEYLATAAEYPLGVVGGSTVVARIRAADQSLVSVLAPTNGTIHYMHADVGEQVAVGQPLLSLETARFARMQLVVGATAFQRRNWTDDYGQWTAGRHIVPHYSHVQIGNTMPVLASADGNVWAGGEFAEGSVIDVTGNWASGYLITPFVAPLLRKSDGVRLVPVKPFALVTAAGESLTKQEIVIEAGPYIWWINGGYAYPRATADWNRLLRFDRTATDVPTTPHDDRFCVFHVPFDGANVMGIAWDAAANRIWYVESRKPKDATPVLAWFHPDELQCENFLDYSDPAAVAAASTHYCTSPSQTNCIHTIPLMDSDDPGKVLYWAAHVVVDAEAAWVAGFASSNVARYSRASGRVDVLPTAASSGFGGLLGTGPWQLVSRPGYLYFTEFFDGDVVRLDKQAFAANPASCKTRNPDGTNPCMSEIHPGVQVKELKAFGDRLYFAGHEEFGYLNLSAWTPGVLYGGLDSLRNAERRKRGEMLSHDLSLGPTGMVVLNDYNAHEVYRLYPKQQ